MKARTSIALISLIIGACLPLALHRVRAEDNGASPSTPQAAYPSDRQTITYRASTASVDTKVAAGASGYLTVVPEFKVNGRQNITINARFSTAAATVGVRVVCYWKPVAGTYYNTTCSPEIIITANDIKDQNGRYMANAEPFDTYGAYFCKVLITTAPSAGTVEVWGGSY